MHYGDHQLMFYALIETISFNYFVLENLVFALL